jgi:hypothetical protein
MLSAPLSAASHATTIVAVRVPGGILVLADSKPAPSDGDKPACKIVPLKNGYLAASGMVRDAARFDVEEIAARAFDSPAHFQARVKMATEEIEAKASEELAHLKAESPERYSAATKSAASANSPAGGIAPVLDVLFLAFENHVAMLAERRFHWNEAKSRLDVQKLDCPGRTCPDGHYVSKIGAVSEIEKFLASHKPSELGETTLHDLMVQQARSTPNETAAPIQILSLQDGAPIWLANEAGCPLQK